MRVVSNVNATIISTCDQLIKSFNPITHSIDTHCAERLGNVNLPDSKPENVLIQQIVYGWHKEKAVLKCFINDFYADNASRVLRADITLYTIFAYLAIFRLHELGFQKFKELTLSQEPSKMSTFILYLFNKEVLWNTLRSSWMKVRDLTFVESKLIVDIEHFIPQMTKLTYELDEKSVSLAAEEAALEEAKARGDVGLPKTHKKAPTQPISPRLTKQRPPIIPEPIRIEQNTTAHEVPAYLERTNLPKIMKKRSEEREESRKTTAAQYDDKYLFTFHETKGGKSKEQIQRELDEQNTKDLKFNSSYVNVPPDFSKIPAKVRLNASTIYREDALYRKQQAKDAAILKNYEEELRGPTEYYLWQKDMKDRDAVEKLKQVALRREQAKISSIEAKEAMSKQKEDNYIVASMLREQAEVIRRQNELEAEIQQLQNQEVVQSIAEVRDTKPYEATKRVIEERVEIGKKVREELEAARLAKEEEMRLEEEVKADKIRQLRALNEVHKKHIVVFDPTQTAGIGLLDEMSYMEMKERLKNEKIKAEEAEILKREDILDSKHKKALDLERRATSIVRARQVKAEANKANIQREKEAKKKAAEDVERAREVAAIALEKELKERREAAKAEQAALKAEQEKIKRQQQYLGAALGQVEETREQQQMLAKEREINILQSRARDRAIQEQESQQKDRQNRDLVIKQERMAKHALDKARNDEMLFEKRASIEKMKAKIIYKKDMFKKGQYQHAVTKEVVIQTNPYAARMNEEIHTKIVSAKLRAGTLGNSNTTSGKIVKISDEM